MTAAAMATSKILVAEDDPDIRAAVVEVLHDEGFEVLEARDGEEALALLSREDPCMLLLDLMMPGKDGFQVREEMAADARLRHIPVVVLTAHGRRPEVSARLSGVTVIPKPVDYATLVAAVRMHCPKP